MDKQYDAFTGVSSLDVSIFRFFSFFHNCKYFGRKSDKTRNLKTWTRAQSVSVSASDLISPLSPAEPPQVTVELQQQEVVYGETVRISCQTRGKPTPSVMWLHNARPLAPSPRHRLTARMLRVSNVGPQDDGLYQCMAENGVGSSQASTRLITVSTGKSRTVVW